MHSYIVLGIAIAIISGPLAFPAFLLGYEWARREQSKAMRMTVRAIDTPDEHHTVIVKNNRRTVI